MRDESLKDLAEFDDVVAELPAALALASPHHLSASLRGRLLRAVETRAGRSRTLALPRAWLRTAAFVAMLALVVALVSWNLQLQQGLAEERTLIQQLRDSAGQQSVVFDVVDNSASQKIALRAVGPRRPGEDPPYGKVYANPNQTQIVAMSGRLPNPDPNEEYRLYVTDRFGTTANVGVIRVDATGFGWLVYDTGARGAGSPFTAARVYLQPKGSNGLDGTLVLLFESR